MATGTATDRPGWWETRWFAFALMVAMAVPLLWPVTPPLTDLIGHMGRYRVELDGAVSPSLRQFYGLNGR